MLKNTPRLTKRTMNDVSERGKRGDTEKPCAMGLSEKSARYSEEYQAMTSETGSNYFA